MIQLFAAFLGQLTLSPFGGSEQNASISGVGTRENGTLVCIWYLQEQFSIEVIAEKVGVRKAVESLQTYIEIHACAPFFGHVGIFCTVKNIIKTLQRDNMITVRIW